MTPSRPLHLLFLSTWYPYPPDNGSRIRVYHLLRALAERHTVHLVTFAPHDGPVPPDDLAALGLCATAAVIPRSPFAQHGLRRLTALASPMPRHLAAMQSPAMERAARAVCRRTAVDTGNPIDIAIASTVLTAPMTLRLPVPRRIVEEHNFLGRMMAERHARAAGPWRRAAAWLTVRKDIAYERRLFRAFDLVTMVSEDDRRAMQAMGCATTRVEVVPNGVDTARLQPGAWPVRRATLVYAGSPTYGPNREAVDWFSRHVLPRVRFAVPETVLQVTGHTAIDVLAGIAEEPGVHLLGHIPDVAPVVGSSWACVLPIHTGGGTRLKALEAMALGTPIVSTAKGVEGLGLVPETHYLQADTAEAFAHQVIRLLGDPGLRARLAARGRACVVDRFDWGGVAGRFVGLVEEVGG